MHLHQHLCLTCVCCMHVLGTMSMCAGRASVPTHVCMVNDSSRAAAEQQQSSRAAEQQSSRAAEQPQSRRRPAQCLASRNDNDQCSAWRRAKTMTSAVPGDAPLTQRATKSLGYGSAFTTGTYASYAPLTQRATKSLGYRSVFTTGTRASYAPPTPTATTSTDELWRVTFGYLYDPTATATTGRPLPDELPRLRDAKAGNPLPSPTATMSTDEEPESESGSS